MGRELYGESELPVLSDDRGRSASDPVRLVAPPVYFRLLAGVDVQAEGGVVRCPVTTTPSLVSGVGRGRAGCGASAALEVGGPTTWAPASREVGHTPLDVALRVSGVSP